MISLPIKKTESISRGNHSANIRIAERYVFRSHSLRTSHISGKQWIILGWSYDQVALTARERISRQYRLRAKYCFKKAMKSEAYDALRGIATVYHHEYREGLALRYYLKARQLDDTSHFSFTDIGNVYLRLADMNKERYKNYEFALTSYMHALKKTRGSARVWALLSLMHAHARVYGDKKCAREYAKKVLVQAKRYKSEIQGFEAHKKICESIIDNPVM